ncbi:MAG: hypothetical protein Q9195_007241 [Heterodermia aff. obscurata]
MAPQTTIPLPANIFSSIGTVFWCIQLVPQIWFNWRQKRTDGLPGLMMFLWAISAVPFGVYAIIQNFAIPIQIQPQIFGALSLVTWAQILIYNNGYSTIRASTLVTVIAALFGGAEILLILTLRPLYNRGVEWPVMTVGVVAATLLAAGLLPPYFEMWKRKGRVETFDPLGGCLFIVCILIEGGIFASHGIWLIRTRKLRKEAKLACKSFDDLPESEDYHVDVARRGSIAAARDIVKDQIERRGSVALSRDLEKGQYVLPEPVDNEKSGSVVKPTKASTVQVTEEEVEPEGVEVLDYGTMPRSGISGSRTRPGYARQDSNMATLANFKISS